MRVIILLLCLVSSNIFAQQAFTETFELGTKSLHLNFDDASIVKVTGWDQSTVEVRANVLINIGKNNDAYRLERSDKDGKIRVSGYIANKKDLPEMLMIKKDDQTYYFEGSSWDDPEVKKFLEEHGDGGFNWMSNGVAWEIDVEVRMPRNAQLEVNSVHGLIEIKDVQGAVRANSRHGGIDIAIAETSNGAFTLSTNWGEIYTNLDFKFDEKRISKNYNKTYVRSTLNRGGGPLIELESKHGNLYLRKQ